MTESLLQKVLQRKHNPWACVSCQREAMIASSVVLTPVPLDANAGQVVTQRMNLFFSIYPTILEWLSSIGVHERSE